MCVLRRIYEARARGRLACIYKDDDEEENCYPMCSFYPPTIKYYLFLSITLQKEKKNKYSRVYGEKKSMVLLLPLYLPYRIRINFFAVSVTE